ncbi:MAG: hypothetical protein ACK5RS_11765 [Acidobacteriota bacterium]
MKKLKPERAIQDHTPQPTLNGGLAFSFVKTSGINAFVIDSAQSSMPEKSLPVKIVCAAMVARPGFSSRWRTWREGLGLASGNISNAPTSIQDAPRWMPNLALSLLIYTK